jgi:glucosylceramidase
MRNVPATVALHFSIDRDRQALLPMIQAAQRAAGRPLKLLASPWSPPAWMKTNGADEPRRQLLPRVPRRLGAVLRALHPGLRGRRRADLGRDGAERARGHQRWDSCLYSAEEERDFVRDHLGPALAAAGLGHVKIVIWDHNRDRMVERASVVYADPPRPRVRVGRRLPLVRRGPLRAACS